MSKHLPETRRRLNAEYRARHREKIRRDAQAYRSQLRQAALNRYGRACAICKFDDERALQIDHIDESGADERRLLGGQNFSGFRFYKVLRDRGWPDGYQTLCANCNIIKYSESKSTPSYESGEPA